MVFVCRFLLAQIILGIFFPSKTHARSLTEFDRKESHAIRSLKKKHKVKKSSDGSKMVANLAGIDEVLRSETPTSSPTSAPSLHPTDECSVPDFIVPGDDSLTRFSFTNEILLDIDCDGGYYESSVIEDAFVSYQNALVALYGCTDDIEYDAAAITQICVLGGADGQDCVDIDESCDPGRRNLQESSVGSANVRYKYNTLGNCRRYCAEKSLPKEDDCVDCGDTRLRRRAQDGDRSLLVEMLNQRGIGANGAKVLSDSKNDCPAECCSNDGRCCGVYPGCKCPPASVTYCKATRCDMPGCCATKDPLSASITVPLFGSCPHFQAECNNPTDQACAPN